MMRFRTYEISLIYTDAFEYAKMTNRFMEMQIFFDVRIAKLNIIQIGRNLLLFVFVIMRYLLLYLSLVYLRHRRIVLEQTITKCYSKKLD